MVVHLKLDHEAAAAQFWFYKARFRKLFLELLQRGVWFADWLHLVTRNDVPKENILPNVPS
jgi:hypothetical protein